jgi:site-specific recombinase XerD
MSVIEKNGRFHLKKRVPVRFKSVERRKVVWIALHTDSREIAELKAPAAWEEMVAGWDAQLDGDTSDAEKRFEAARRIAQRKGFRYLPAEQVAKLPLDEIMQRFEVAKDRRGHANKQVLRATLGLESPPQITLAGALEAYWPLARDKIRGKSEDQLRRWRNPRIKAIRNLVEVVGDIPLSELTRDHMLDFRDWWLDEIDRKDLTPNTANKDFSHLSGTFKLVDEKKRLGLEIGPLMASLRLNEGEKRHRPPFSEQWIREVIMAPGALDGLNDQARAIMLGMVNTGYRPSEGACLGPDQIRLDAEIPHISIEPVGRTLKSHYSRRLIPLVGVSLEAFRTFPNGFPRYDDNPGLSATVNKFLRENGLRETPGHSLYSLRHSFEDRLLDADVDERIRRDLMGHTLNRERYGKGPSLEKLHGILEGIAI